MRSTESFAALHRALERYAQFKENKAREEALAEEAAELKRARIMNRAEPGYERKDGKL